MAEVAKPDASPQQPQAEEAATARLRPLRPPACRYADAGALQVVAADVAQVDVMFSGSVPVGDRRR